MKAIHIAPKARKELLNGDVVPSWVIFEIELIKEKRKIPYKVSVTIGTITDIKLAVNPSFLPDSNDILPLQCYYSEFGDKLFADQNHANRH
jgi:hypothetical protein